MNKNMTGNEIKKRLQKIIPYCSGAETRELVELLNDCVIVNKNRLPEFGTLKIIDGYDKTFLTFSNTLKIQKSVKKSVNDNGEYIQFTRQELIDNIADELQMKYNGLYMTKPDTIK